MLHNLLWSITKIINKTNLTHLLYFTFQAVINMQKFSAIKINFIAYVSTLFIKNESRSIKK